MNLFGTIENPYRTILLHMADRLLLNRNGYPVDHKNNRSLTSSTNLRLNQGVSRKEVKEQTTQWKIDFLPCVFAPLRPLRETSLRTLDI